MINKLISPISEVAHKYPNIVQAVRYTASITTYQARLVVWAHINGLSGHVGSEKVKGFGTLKNLVSQAVKYRNA